MWFVGVIFLLQSLCCITYGLSSCMLDTLRCARQRIPLSTHKELAETLEDLDDLCRSQMLFFSCLEEVAFLHENVKELGRLPGNLEYARLLMRDLCSKDSIWQRRYLQMAPCINKQDTDDCVTDSFLSTVSDEDASVITRCSALENALDCISTTLSTQCDLEASNVFHFLFKIATDGDPECDPSTEPLSKLERLDSSRHIKNGTERKTKYSDAYMTLLKRIGTLEEPQFSDEMESNEHYSKLEKLGTFIDIKKNEEKWQYSFHASNQMDDTENPFLVSELSGEFPEAPAETTTSVMDYEDDYPVTENIDTEFPDDADLQSGPPESETDELGESSSYVGVHDKQHEESKAEYHTDHAVSSGYSKDDPLFETGNSELSGELSEAEIKTRVVPENSHHTSSAELLDTPTETTTSTVKDYEDDYPVTENIDVEFPYDAEYRVESRPASDKDERGESSSFIDLYDKQHEGVEENESEYHTNLYDEVLEANVPSEYSKDEPFFEADKSDFEKVTFDDFKRQIKNHVSKVRSNSDALKELRIHKDLRIRNFPDGRMALYWREMDATPFENMTCTWKDECKETAHFQCLIEPRVKEPMCPIVAENIEDLEEVNPELIDPDLGAELVETILDEASDLNEGNFLEENQIPDSSEEIPEVSPLSDKNLDATTEADVDTTEVPVLQSRRGKLFPTTDDFIRSQHFSPEFLAKVSDKDRSNPKPIKTVTYYSEDSSDLNASLHVTYFSNGRIIMSFTQKIFEPIEEVICVRVNECHPAAFRVFKCIMTPKSEPQCPPFRSESESATESSEQEPPKSSHGEEIVTSTDITLEDLGTTVHDSEEIVTSTDITPEDLGTTVQDSDEFGNLETLVKDLEENLFDESEMNGRAVTVDSSESFISTDPVRSTAAPGAAFTFEQDLTSSDMQLSSEHIEPTPSAADVDSSANSIDSSGGDFSESSENLTESTGNILRISTEL